MPTSHTAARLPRSHAAVPAPAPVAAAPNPAPGQSRGQHSTGCPPWFGGRTQNRTRAAPTHWLQAACSLPPTGTGIDLACFRGSAGSICFPTRLSESRPPTLTLGTAQPRQQHGLRSQQEDGRALCTVWRFPALGLRPGAGGALGTGAWAGLTHPETGQALPVRDGRDRLQSGSPWLRPAAARLYGRGLQVFGLEVQCSFYHPMTSSQTSFPWPPLCPDWPRFLLALIPGPSCMTHVCPPLWAAALTLERIPPLPETYLSLFPIWVS